MKALFFYHPDQVSPEELENDLLQLPDWRRRKVMSYRFLTDRVLCAKAYLLLRKVLKEAYGIEGCPAFSYLENGKPVLKDYPDIHFNLSHCKQGVMCVVDDRPVGCDMEEIEQKLDLDLCHLCFNEEEIRAIQGAENPCVAFTRLWTQKEAFVKLTGKGIPDDLPSLFPSGLPDNCCFQTVTEEDRQLVYTIASW